MRWAPLLAMALITPLSPASGNDAVDSAESQAAKRIITLAPFLSELVVTAGAGDALIGVSAYSDHPPMVKDLPLIGDAFRVDWEQVLQLKPDLALVWTSGNPRGTAEAFARLGITAQSLDPQQFADIPAALRMIGQWAGTSAAAEAAAQQFEQRLRQLRQHYSNRPLLRVFYQISRQPLFTLNGEHLASAVIELCGGENIFAQLPTRAPQVSLEAVLEARPEVILIGSEQTDDVSHWGRWQRLPAVANKAIFQIQPDHLIRQTPRILDGVEQVCERLQQARDHSLVPNH
ncbi:MAG: cobalamin-binding protein [Wenzhouxiangellaceae bacterium]